MSGEHAYDVAEKVTILLSEWGIRIPEDIEAEVGVLLEKEYAEVEEKAWMYDGLCD